MGQERKPGGATRNLRERSEASLKAAEPEFQEMSPDEIKAMVHELRRHQNELARQNDELRRSQASLLESNKKYHDFYEFAPVGFLSLDKSGLIHEVNFTLARQLGLDRQKLINQPLTGFVRDADIASLHGCLARLFQDASGEYCELGLKRQDGSVFWARLDGVALQDVGGRPVCRLAVSDISGLMQAQRQLRESQTLFASFMGHLPSVAVIRDLSGRYLYVNETWEKTFHKTREEWLNKTTDDLWPRQEAEKFKNQDRLVLKTGKALQTLVSLPHDDGLHHWITYRFPITDSCGQPIMIGINAVDITEHMETKLHLEQLLDSSPAAIYTCKPEGDFASTYISENVKALVGWESRHFMEELRFWLNHVHPEDRPRLLAQLELPWPEDRQSQEYRFLARDGTYRWMRDEINLVRDEDGKPVKIAGAWMDITARKETETMIEKERQRFYSLLEVLPAMVCLIAPDLTIRFANRRFREAFGDSQEINCYKLVYGRQTPCDECDVGKVLKTRKPVEWERTTTQGRTFQIFSYPFADIDGSPMVLKLGIDITERKALEAQLLQAQKMEAVGRLAGGVAHDFNNLLMAIMGYGDLMRGSLMEADPLYHYAEDIIKATERAASLTQQLLAFSRQQVVQPRVIDLNRVAADLEKMLRRLIEENIELEIVADPDLGMVKVDPGQIGQIILNLAVNARDAMPTGGRLTLTTANVDLAAGHKCYGESPPPGQYVMLAVSDTGGGMDAATLTHIFEPFFTTKEVGKGTGLGLPMVYGMVKQNRGFVEVENRAEQGVTFRIYLPRHKAAVEAPRSGINLAEKLEGSETILVVEDEDALRTLLCRFFRLYGYQVLEARHSGEALLICERHQGPIHLLMTDVVMPQMSGQELAERLAPLHPEMSTFYMSGYTDSDLLLNGVQEPAKLFIAKPFRPMDLVKRVREVLDASRGGRGDYPAA